MSHNTQHMSIKDKIMSHLPGHKNQDKNHNGVPDRLETSTAPLASTTASTSTAVLPGTAVSTTTTVATKDVTGLPLQGNVLEDKTITSTTVATEPALVETVATDLNRNGIPDQLESTSSFGFVGSVPANQTTLVEVTEAPALVERVEKPAVVHEVLKTEEVIQVQPVIEREREQLDVYEVVQPIKEREVIETEVREEVLPAQMAVILEDDSQFLADRSAPSDVSTLEVAPTRSQTIENAPIVHETIVHKVIEEVQPVIYKEVDRPILVKETLPIYEKVVEAPRAHHTVLPMMDLGVKTVLSSDLNGNGIPDALETSMANTSLNANTRL